MIRVRLSEGAAALEKFDGVTVLRDLGRIQEVSWEGRARDFLAHLVQDHGVEHFEVAQPTLHDIFVRIAGEDSSG